MKKSYTFLLNFGYAESGMLAFVPCTSKQTYANAKVALIDLAIFFKEKFLENTQVTLNKCCLECKAKDAEAKFCSKCRTSLKENDFNDEEYMEFVQNVGCSSNDSVGDYMEWSDEHRWEIGMLGPDKNTRVVYVAEKVLAAAIGFSPDDRVTIDSIFADRTKSGSDSFSFWG